METRLIILASTLALGSTSVACKKTEATASGAPSAQASATALGGSPKTGVDAILSDFEGAATVSVKSKQETMSLAIQVKKGMVRFDLPPDLAKQAELSGSAYAIVNASEGKLSGVVDERKMIIEVDFKKLEEQIKAMAPKPPGKAPGSAPAPTEPPPKITKTGRMDKVAGFGCEDWQVVTSEGDKATVCVAGAGTSWLNIPALSLPKEAQWAAELLDGKHFPLRLIAFNKAGTEEARIELTKLEKKALPESLFQVPQGYQRIDLQQFMQGMMGMAAMGMPGGPGMPPGAGMPPGVKMTPEMQAMIKKMQEQQAKKQGAPH
jgi:hypothetical protein